MIKVLFAEPHKILCEGIYSLLKDDSEIRIIGYAFNYKEIFRFLSTYETNILVLDNSVSELMCVETTKQVKQNFKDVKVLALSSSNDEKDLMEMFEAGANGYVSKKTGMEDLSTAIKRIATGRYFICSEIALEMLQRLNENKFILKNTPYEGLNLSDREIEILQLIGEGLTNNEIADKLFTSKRTVETHRKNIIEKTGAKNTANLIKFAIMNRIIQN